MNFLHFNRTISIQRLSRTSVSVCLCCAIGCTRYTPKLGSYRITQFSEANVLVPPELSQPTGSTQVTSIAFGNGESTPGTIDSGQCVIEGQSFALHPKTGGRVWSVTSPTAAAWNAPALQASGESEWIVFASHLASLASRGCFPPGVSSYSMQRRIVEAIPIPAANALRFYYLLTSTGSVDLQPGMQVRFETLGPGKENGKPRAHTVELSVVGQAPTGVAVKMGPRQKDEARNEGLPFLDLPQVLSHRPYLRLFLEQAATDTERARKAMLLGATSTDGLDAETTDILRNGEKSCVTRQTTVTCIVFPESAVSLLTSVSLNGHNRWYAPGTTLSQVVDAVPEARRANALATLSLERQTAAGFVPVTFSRSQEVLADLFVINGDRIRWRE